MMIACYLELYEEGEVEHISGSTHGAYSLAAPNPKTLLKGLVKLNIKKCSATGM